jgi:hypothetical protein
MHLYGLEWPDGMERWQVELKLYQNPTWDPTPTPAWKHFIRACQILWGPNNPRAQFVWHPWAVDMTIEACRTRELALMGPSSNGKTVWMAVWTLGNLLADPVHTLIFLTSIGIERAKQKVWGTVEHFYNGLPPQASAGLDYVSNPTPSIMVEVNGRRLSTAGIHLVAAAAANSREASNKLQGSKAFSNPGMANGRCFLVADELSDLSHAVLSATGNLKSNPFFHFSAAFNPRHKYDPGAIMAEPAGGWETVTIDSERWETKRGGICLHFDDVRNPNWLALQEHRRQGKLDSDFKDPWPNKGAFLVEEEMTKGDITSPDYWRNSRGWWCPLGSEQTVYTDEDIKGAGADRNFTDWLLTKPKVRVLGVDSAFSSGGDNTIVTILDMGYCNQRRCPVVDVVATEEITIDATNKTKTGSRQVGEGVLALMRKYSVPIPDLGFDATNITAADALAEVLGSNDFFRVDFRGNATDTPVSYLDETPAKDKYGNRVTELWFFGKELLRHTQLYGIPDETASELIVRRFETSKAGGLSKMTVESKKDMKKRTGGRSPDRADSLAIALDVLRQRHGLRTHQSNTLIQTNSPTSSAWLDFCKEKASARVKLRF